MTKRRKKSLTRQILPGMLAAGVLWGGFAAQAEAAGTYHLKEAARDGDEIACNNTVTEAKNLGAPEFNGAEYAVGYVSGGIVANANGNKLTLNTGAKFTHASDANGLYYFSIYGGKVGNASSNANYNTVIVNGGDYEIEYLAGGYGQTASHNTVTINDTTGTFTAKEAIMGGGGTGHSDYNTVNINGGTFSKNIKIAGGGFSGNSHNNTVNINGGTFSDNTKIYGGSANAGTASGNTVNITGGTFDFGTEIIGGYSAYGNADNNTVTISGGSFDGSAKLFGGNNAGNNNTLNLKIKGLTVYSVDGFQNLNFYIPKTAQANDIMLTVANSNENTMDLSNATIKAGVQDGSTLKTGDTIYLIKAALRTSISGYETITTGTLTDPAILITGWRLRLPTKRSKPPSAASPDCLPTLSPSPKPVPAVSLS